MRPVEDANWHIGGKRYKLSVDYGGLTPRDVGHLLQLAVALLGAAGAFDVEEFVTRHRLWNLFTEVR